MLRRFKRSSHATIEGVGCVHHRDGSVTHFRLSGRPIQSVVSRIGRAIFGLAWLFPKMHGAITHPTSVRNTIADAVVDLIDAGAGAGSLVMNTSGDVEVATLTFSDPAFGAAASAVATAAAITSDSDATGGTIAKFVAQDSDSNAVFQGSVTATSGGGDIELSSLVIAASDTVSISSLTYTAPA